MGAAIVGMELAALIVAILAFGWPVLLVGAPLLVGTLVVLAVVPLLELVRRRLDRRRADRWDQAAVPGGLMSGFFAVSAIPEQPPLPPVDVPILRAARGWAQDTAREWAAGARGWAHRRSPGATSAARPGPVARPVSRTPALTGRLARSVRGLRRPPR